MKSKQPFHPVLAALLLLWTALGGCLEGEIQVDTDTAPSDDTGAADTATPSDCVDGSTRVCGRSEGECTKGTQTCEEGRWTDCEGGRQPAPSDRSCDGRDNDCDGQIDEDCNCDPGDKTQCGTDLGACQKGLQTCSDEGTWGECEDAVGPEAEFCDGADNDCDGEVDEELTRPCGRDTGVCRKGTATCENGMWSDCSNSVDAKPETCNGRDDDCDGEVDELLTRDCGTNKGVCRRGIEQCKDGSWTACQGGSQGVPNEEMENERGNLCDQKDNDCDGQIDEKCDCTDGDSRQCGTNEGTCRAGTQICSGGRWSACQGKKGPDTEVCDGKDNDCDGRVDNGLRRECGKNVGVCRTGTQTCVSGQWSNCDDIGPSPETCNGKDDDCNNAIDENLSRKCPNQKGVCQGAVVRCSGARFPSCGSNEYGGNYEKTESSCGDGRDNDCDGDVDCNDADCAGNACAGAGTACLPSGACGEKACRDGKDNDGDSKSDCQDDDCPDCAKGAICSSGGVCEERNCSDTKDNDSDGKTDCADADCDGLPCRQGCVNGRLHMCRSNQCAPTSLICGF